jgi:DNA-binding IclR family transcriptional regulator
MDMLGRPEDGPRRSGVGTLDRALAIVDAVEAGARTLAGVADETRLPRSTAHRLLKALQVHGYVGLEPRAGYRLGPRLLRLAATARREAPLRDLAHPALERLARATGESAQLYVRSGDMRVCVDAVESERELRTIVPVGASLPLSAGSAAKVFLAFDPDRIRHIRRATDPERFARDIELVTTRGSASSAGEREVGVASVSAPVVGPDEMLVAVVSVSGPAGRMGRASGHRAAPAVRRAAREIEAVLGSPA